MFRICLDYDRETVCEALMGQEVARRYPQRERLTMLHPRQCMLAAECCCCSAATAAADCCWPKFIGFKPAAS